jgi:hypothetical protein
MKWEVYQGLSINASIKRFLKDAATLGHHPVTEKGCQGA